MNVYLVIVLIQLIIEHLGLERANLCDAGVGDLVATVIRTVKP